MHFDVFHQLSDTGFGWFHLVGVNLVPGRHINRHKRISSDFFNLNKFFTFLSDASRCCVQEETLNVAVG